MRRVGTAAAAAANVPTLDHLHSNETIIGKSRLGVYGTPAFQIPPFLFQLCGWLCLVSMSMRLIMTCRFTYSNTSWVCVPALKLPTALLIFSHSFWLVQLHQTTRYSFGILTFNRWDVRLSQSRRDPSAYTVTAHAAREITAAEDKKKDTHREKEKTNQMKSERRVERIVCGTYRRCWRRRTRSSGSRESTPGPAAAWASSWAGTSSWLLNLFRAGGI